MKSAGEPNAWKPITVSWHGQSFFIVKSSKGTRIAFDPHQIPEYGRTLGLKADLVVISHNHDDHNRVDAVSDTVWMALFGLSAGRLKVSANAHAKLKTPIHFWIVPKAATAETS